MIHKTKQQISELIDSDNTFIKILDIYKKNDFSTGTLYEVSDENKTGISNLIYLIELNSDTQFIIAPVFSSEKTITWNFSYSKKLEEILQLDQSYITKNTICPLYFYDKYTGDVQFLSVVKLNDWIDNGIVGKNGKSVYYWNDKLPNNDSIKLKDLRSDLFVKSLPFYSNKELKQLCKDYATKHVEKFNAGSRSLKTQISNISNGLYAQLKIYLDLVKAGYNVNMDWHNEDDLGIDIKYFVNGTQINIDVKSTKTKDLKISKFRKETDFYAICTWNKNEPVFNGFLHKFYFWKSSILKSDAPVQENEMYSKSLDSLQDYITLDIQDLFNINNNYLNLKRKKNETLFLV